MISRVLLHKLDPKKLIGSIEFCYRSVDHKNLVFSTGFCYRSLKAMQFV